MKERIDYIPPSIPVMVSHRSVTVNNKRYLCIINFHRETIVVSYEGNTVYRGNLSGYTSFVGNFEDYMIHLINQG